MNCRKVHNSVSFGEPADRCSGWKSGEAVCFMLKLASQVPSQAMLLMFVKSLWLSYRISNHLRPWSYLSLQRKFRRTNFICQGNLETLSAVFELLGFPQDLAFSRAMLLSSVSLHGAAACWDISQTSRAAVRSFRHRKYLLLSSD